MHTHTHTAHTHLHTHSPLLYPYLVVGYMATGMCKRMVHYTHASLKATHVRTGVCFKQQDAVFRCSPVIRISETPGWRQLPQQDTHAPLKATHVWECFLSNMMAHKAPVFRCPPVFRISETPVWSWVRTKSSYCQRLSREIHMHTHTHARTQLRHSLTDS